MKRHANLFPKIVTFENLLLAAKRATRGKKAKNSVISFGFNLENELISLKQQLQTKSYRPRPYSQFVVKEPKVRKICSSDFRDRVVHHAICNFLEPIIESRSIFDSYNRNNNDPGNRNNNVGFRLVSTRLKFGQKMSSKDCICVAKAMSRSLLLS